MEKTKSIELFSCGFRDGQYGAGPIKKMKDYGFGIILQYPSDHRAHYKADATGGKEWSIDIKNPNGMYSNFLGYARIGKHRSEYWIEGTKVNQKPPLQLMEKYLELPGIQEMLVAMGFRKQPESLAEIYIANGFQNVGPYILLGEY